VISRGARKAGTVSKERKAGNQKTKGGKTGGRPKPSGGRGGQLGPGRPTASYLKRSASEDRGFGYTNLEISRKKKRIHGDPKVRKSIKALKNRKKVATFADGDPREHKEPTTRMKVREKPNKKRTRLGRVRNDGT